MNRPSRDTPGGRAYQDIRSLARRDQRDVAEYLMLYALEGFLARLATSRHADDFVLKGGVLMAAFAARRPTRDIDLAAAGFPNDVDEVVIRIVSIIGSDIGDGLTFDPALVSGVQIRDEADCTGVRVKVTAILATARLALHVDVNFGDPIWPAPTQAEVPRLLGGTIRLKGYPDHMVLAEKIVTAVERGTANTRWRDFVDTVALSRTRTIHMTDLAEAIRAVAAYRGVMLRPLGEVLDGMAPLAQARWTNWRRKQRLGDSTPEQFQELLDLVTRFADPAVEGTEELTWTPESQVWRAASVSSAT